MAFQGRFFATEYWSVPVFGMSHGEAFLAMQTCDSYIAFVLGIRFMLSREVLVSRLRRSEDSTQEDIKSEGFEVGRKWAAESAEAIELQRLETARADERHWDAILTTCNMSAYAPCELLAFAIRPESEKDRDAAVDFWEFILGDDIDVTRSDDWLRGFAEAALSVWDSVTDEV